MKLFILSFMCLVSFIPASMADEAFDQATKGMSAVQKEIVRAQVDRISKMSPEEQSKFLEDTMKELNSPERQEKMKKEMESLSPEKRKQMEDMLKGLKGE